ncbi:MAG: type 4b pilus protein PilO2 [Candidatus Symbiodolus clandestinus]
MSETVDSETLLLPLRGYDFAVAGLIWQPLTDLKKLTQETKKLIKKEQCEIFVVHRQGNKAQCGMLSTLPSVAKRRYYGLALLLMEKLGNDWLAIFALQDGRYGLIGVESGQVVPGCDALFSSAEEVVAHFNNYKSLFNWQTIYAPSELALGGESLVLEQTLKGITPKRPKQLTDTQILNQQSKSLGLKLIGIAVLVVVGVIAWNRYQQKQEEARLARLRTLQAQKAKKNPPVQEVWRQQAPAMELLRDCVQAITHYPITIGGWQAAGFLCDAKQAKAIYQRVAPSTVNKFLAALPESYQAQHILLKGGESAQLMQPIRIDTNRQNEQLQSLTTLTQDILSKIQLGVASGRVDDVFSAKKQSANFELTSQTSPLLLLQDINLDGLVIKHLTATLTQDGIITWKISGVLYGQ